MLKPCLLLLAGGLAAQHSTLLLPSDHSVALLVASLCLLRPRRGWPVAMFLCGYAVFMLAAGDVIKHRLSTSYAGDSMLARVRIVDVPRVTDETVVMRLEPLDDHRIPPLVRVSWFQPPYLPSLGEVWELELRLKRPRGTRNPGVYDHEAWLFRERIQATGYVVGSQRNRLLWSETGSFLDRLRAGFSKRAHMATESDAVAAVLVAIGVGRRHLVSAEQWDRFAISGTSHLMAISGLHVGLAGLFAFLATFALAGLVPRRRNNYVLAVAGGTLFALAYAVISGLGVPARRAALMLVVAALTLARRRAVDPAAALSLAAMLVFLTDPIATMTPGFHLSFAAVALLLWLARRKQAAPGRWRLLEAPKQLLIMQVFLLFGLLPLTVSIFQRFAPLATPVNLVAVPLFSIVTVPFSLAGLIAGGISEPLALALLSTAGLSIELLDRYISLLVQLPVAQVPLAELQGAAVMLILLPIAWVLLPRGWPGRRVALLGVISIVLWRPAPPPPGCFDTWVLDVGQGLAVTVQTHEDVMLYDTGIAWRGGGSIAEHSIVPFLRSRGMNRIAWLVISHDDLDHSGGLAAVRDAFAVGKVMAGESLQAGADQPCRAGQRWLSAGVAFDVLHPPTAATSKGNASSCVLRVSTGPHGLLLTGDIEAQSEYWLLEHGGLLASQVAVVPHHGSKTSSIAPFVDTVRPEYAIVSAGYANRWGFPKPRIVERWQQAGAKVLTTATSGAVHFRMCAAAGVANMSEERQKSRRFWHAGT